MSSCVKCTTCGKCDCKCSCVKEENKANWNWDNFQKMVQGYHPPFKSINDEELPKRFSLIIVDNNADEDWEIEYRTRVNVIQMANILVDYFGIDADALPKDGFEIKGLIETDFDDEEEED